MAEVIQFPSKRNTLDDSAYLDQADEMVSSPDIACKIEGVCLALTGAISRGIVQPDKFFIVYQEKNTVAYMSFSFTPEELLEVIDTILQHKGKNL